MLLSDSASLCSQSSLADNPFLTPALLRLAFLRADSAFTPQITQKNCLGLFFASYNLAAFARVQLVFAEQSHDFTCRHIPPFRRAIAGSLRRGACRSASEIVVRLARIHTWQGVTGI